VARLSSVQPAQLQPSQLVQAITALEEQQPHELDSRHAVLAFCVNKASLLRVLLVNIKISKARQSANHAGPKLSELTHHLNSAVD